MSAAAGEYGQGDVVIVDVTAWKRWYNAQKPRGKWYTSAPVWFIDSEPYSEAGEARRDMMTLDRKVLAGIPERFILRAVKNDAT